MLSKQFEAVDLLRLCLLSVTLSALTLPADGAQSGDFIYSVVNGTEVTITGYVGMGGSLTIPSTLAGLPVTRIGDNAFDDHAELTGTLTIPDSVTEIGDYAFRFCYKLTGLKLGNGVETIGVYAFAACGGLTGELMLPPGVKTIKEAAFYECGGLSGKLVLPEGVTTLGDYAFADCLHLTENLTVPDSVTRIGVGAFMGCRNLSGLTIGTAVTKIGYYAFRDCNGISGNVTIPDGVRKIEINTFAACSNLVSVIVGSGVSDIGYGSFYGCAKLAGVYFKASPPNLDPSAFLGMAATIGYVAGQEGWGAATFGGRPTAVWLATAFFDAGLGTASYGLKTYNVGHPYGELPTAARLLFAFAGWRTASHNLGSVVTVDSQVPYVAGSFRLYATWALPFQTVTFNTQGGGAVVPANKTVTYGMAYGALPTPTRAGYSFRGWSLNADGKGTVWNNTLVTSLSNHTLYADWLALTYTVTFDAQGGVTPSGSTLVLYDSAYGALPGSCRLGYAFGGWWTGFDGTGDHVTESFVVQRTIDHTLYAKWTYNPQAAQSVPAGVALSLPLPSTFTGATKITVKGLPTGLTYNATTRTVNGVPTKPGAFAVTVAAAGVAVESLEFTFTVVPLPIWAYGTFSGHHFGPGVASMTISAQGKVSGKVSFAGTNSTFSAVSFAAGGNPATGFRLAATAKSGKTALPLELMLKQESPPAPQTLGKAEGSFQSGSDSYYLFLKRNVWKEEPAWLAPYIGYYTATLSGSDTHGSGLLTLTVDKNGKVKVAGKLADGTAVSQSGNLVLSKDMDFIFITAHIYVAPATYKGGYLYGAAEFAKSPSGKVYFWRIYGATFEWVSRNPQTTGTYGQGFNRKPALTGGWYDKLENLYEYYEHLDLFASADTAAPVPLLTVGTAKYPAARWDPAGVTVTVVTNKAGVMTGLTAPKTDAPTDADHNGVWEYGAENVLGLKVGLTRATGIFKGSFKAWFDYGTTHTSKTLSYEGALTPVREDMGDGVAGRGFFQWPDKAVPAPPAKPYAFKWSYDFLLWCQ